MRDIVSCFSEHSISVSNPSCSSYTSNANNCITPSQSQSQCQIPIPSAQNAVASVYKVVLSNQTQFLVKVTWSRTNSAQGLTISFADKNDNDHDQNDNNNNNNPSSSIFKLNINSRLFRKKKGNKAFDSFQSSKVELFWDFTNAKFESNPEPAEGFYVIVAFDSEIGLILGDAPDEAAAKKLRISKSPEAKTRLISRQEHCSAPSSAAVVYSTRARFGDNGAAHDIVIKAQFAQHYQIGPKCSDQLHQSPVLSVSIDKKTVIRVKRLQWNFRGNQTIFVDGLLVDLLWDVHDWFFRPSSTPSSSNGGYAVFMFRTRSGMDSRLWLEEKLLAQSQSKEQERAEFSLLIYACKTSQL